MKFQPTLIGWGIIVYVVLSMAATLIVFLTGGVWEPVPVFCAGIAGQVITLLIIIEGLILLGRFIKRKVSGKKGKKNE